MSYEVVVCRINNIRPHPNADKIKLGSACGSQLVIGLDTQEGELGLFFDVDGILDKEFAEKNNLLSYKDPVTGERKGGFFDSKSPRIRAQKFRGEKSEGFWCGLNYLDYIKADLSSLKEGDRFTSFGGKTIASKYYSPATMRAIRNGSNQRTIRKGSTLWFPQHVKDTIQLRHILGNIPSPSIVYFTEKLHGCVKPGTFVNMNNGTKKRIEDIKIGEYVLGMSNGRLVESKVLNVFNNGLSQDWLSIKIPSGKRGNSHVNITCTSNHKVWCSSVNSYKEAKDLSLGDRVNLAYFEEQLSYIQEQVILGKMLGDGSLKLTSTSGVIEFAHKEEHREYFEWTANSLGNLFNPNIQKRLSGYGTNMIAGRTFSFPILKERFEEWLPFEGKSIKEVPENCINKIGPIALAFWYMDDGSLGHNEGQEDRANFATCRYNKESIENICKVFYNYNIIPTPYKSGKYWRIRLNSKEAEKFFVLICPYICNGMKYKLPEYFRKYPNFLPQEKFIPHVEERDIVEIKKGGIHTRLDIETETHNFFANGVLVHNSSHRYGQVLDEQYLPWWKKGLNKVGNFFPEATYKYLHGSKNVILSKTTGEGFYGTNSFRFKATEGISLKKGEVLYGEIVGYVHGNTPIMPSQEIVKSEVQDLIPLYGDTIHFTYGNKEGQCSFHVYRIIHMGEDGYYVELPWLQVKKRCRELGIQHVPEVLHTPIFYTGNSEELAILSEELNKGPSLLDSSHIREGIVMRIEDNNGNTTFIKDKNFHFKVLEGIIKSKDDYVDLEESS